MPKILRSDWLPPTAAFGTRVAAAVGSSGNAAFDITGGGGALAARVAGPGTDVGPRITADGAGPAGAAGAEEADAEAADADAHGVLRCGWRKPLPGTTLAAAASGGKRSAAAAPGTAGREDEGAGRRADEAAARATRSRTCPEDWEDEREAVDCFALSRRPLVIPAH